KGQPILVGTVSVEVSEHLSTLLKRRGIKHNVLNAKHHEREAEIIVEAGEKGAVTIATNMAGRGTDIKLGGSSEPDAHEGWTEQHERFAQDIMQKYPTVTRDMLEGRSLESLEVLSLGGLYVLGTERHEARRIDNQLRGRSGRQGDPGESRFYLSFEDDLLRRFGGQRMQSVIDRIGLEEDVPIEAGMVSGSVRRAQEQVESHNFQIRKKILQYDDVLNKQREVIYAIRRDILMGEDVDTWDYVEEVLSDVVGQYISENVYPENWDMEALSAEINRFYPSQIDFESLDVESLSSEEILEMVLEDARARLGERKVEWEERTAELKKRGLIRADGIELFEEAERRTLLSIVDSRWREHLYDMDSLREGIGWRGLSQRDPLVEYKREGYDMFQEMVRGLKEDYVTYIYRIENVNLREEPEMQQLSYSGGDGEPNPRPKSPRRVERKIGRNDPCPCGSGKKYKKCHGRVDVETPAAGGRSTEMGG
ncbi:MAG TPA: SEC-C metal-binding domain-containing protein, partial [Rubrobacteraceae bacterium]|nr:SEC-C metal-binding domain-containing protein [Rubrobacteraceae bacterium]